jgi:hypothetical protein
MFEQNSTHLRIGVHEARIKGYIKIASIDAIKILTVALLELRASYGCVVLSMLP